MFAGRVLLAGRSLRARRAIGVRGPGAHDPARTDRVRTFIATGGRKGAARRKKT